MWYPRWDPGRETGKEEKNTWRKCEYIQSLVNGTAQRLVHLLCQTYQVIKPLTIREMIWQTLLYYLCTFSVNLKLLLKAYFILFKSIGILNWFSSTEIQYLEDGYHTLISVWVELAPGPVGNKKCHAWRKVEMNYPKARVIRMDTGLKVMGSQ
jgi:hypothetical protein